MPEALEAERIDHLTVHRKIISVESFVSIDLPLDLHGWGFGMHKVSVLVN